MKTIVYRYIYLLLILFVGCISIRKVEKTKSAELLEIINNKFERNSERNIALEKVKIVIKGKNNYNLNGKIYIIRNKGVFLTAQYMGFEIFRIIITEDSIKYINRLKRNYMFISMSDAKRKFVKNINLDVIENILINGIITNKELEVKKYIKYYKIENRQYIFNPPSIKGKNIKMYYEEDLTLYQADYFDNINSVFFTLNVDYNETKNPECINSELIINNENYKIEMEIGNIENKTIEIPDIKLNKRYNEIIL